jgi:O-antigen ligase
MQATDNPKKNDVTTAKIKIVTVENALRCLFIFSVFLAIFSPTMIYVAAFSALLTLVKKELREVVPQLLRMAPVRLGLLYLWIVLLGVFYTPATGFDITKEILVSVLPVFLFPLLIPLFSDKAWQRRLLMALLASGVVLALRMLAENFHLIPSAWGRHFFLFNVHYIQESAALAALGIYLSLYLALEAPTRMAKVTYIALALFLTVVLLGFQGERVGMVLSFIALVLFFFQHLRALHWIFLMLVGYTALFAVSYHFSQNTHERLNALANETRAINSDGSANKVFGSSTALRWYTLKSGLEVSREQPIFGYGTGAFSMSHKSNPPMTGNLLKYLDTTTPEVGAIFILMRHGLLGLLIFLAFLFSWWWVCRSLGFNRSSLVFAGIAILVLADCSFPAFYHSRGWLWLFAVIIAGSGALFEQRFPANKVRC